jgi:TPP-dependent pyruvate/acetoin dehydrogenase alpha subunit
MAAVKSALPNPGSQWADTPDPEAGLARQLFYYMSLQREVEDRIERKLYRQGKIQGGVYVGRGQEAICIGAGMAAQPDDVLFPCHTWDCTSCAAYTRGRCSPSTWAASAG